MVRMILFSIVSLVIAMRAHAISLGSAEDISAEARAKARSFLSANPRRTLGWIANTKSMTPTFGEDYIVVLEPKPFEELERDDIVTFTADWAPTMVVHRLYSRLRRGWLTKGDNLTKPDPTLLDEGHYSGVVVIAAIHKRTGRVTTVL